MLARKLPPPPHSFLFYPSPFIFILPLHSFLFYLFIHFYFTSPTLNFFYHPSSFLFYHPLIFLPSLHFFCFYSPSFFFVFTPPFLFYLPIPILLLPYSSIHFTIILFFIYGIITLLIVFFLKKL
jgi:hypothetical protein